MRSRVSSSRHSLPHPPEGPCLRDLGRSRGRQGCHTRPSPTTTIACQPPRYGMCTRSHACFYRVHADYTVSLQINRSIDIVFFSCALARELAGRKPRAWALTEPCPGSFRVCSHAPVTRPTRAPTCPATPARCPYIIEEGAADESSVGGEDEVADYHTALAVAVSRLIGLDLSARSAAPRNACPPCRPIPARSFVCS